MSVRDAIRYGIQDNPSELKNSIYSALDAKVADALELKKISTASEYFNEPEEEYDGGEEEVMEWKRGDPHGAQVVATKGHDTVNHPHSGSMPSYKKPEPKGKKPSKKK